jgi:hypothetical protein
MGRACSTNGDKRNAYRILMGKPEGKRPLGRLRRRWVYKIEMDLREIDCDGMDWIYLAQDKDHSPHTRMSSRLDALSTVGTVSCLL